MQQVMERMGVHHDFRRMVAIMYNSSEYKVKVNSHVGGEFKPTNGLSQGSPLSPILYLLVLQSFLSLLNTTDALTGVHIPGEGGDEEQPAIIKALGFADDLVIFLRNADQLDEFKRLLAIYEDGSGALNSWEKTFGMRVGSLRGSDYLPQGWEEGRDINTTNSLIRYLGIFLAPWDAGRGSSQVGRDGHSQIEEALRAMAGTRDTAVATRSEYRHPKPCASMCLVPGTGADTTEPSPDAGSVATVRMEIL